MGCDNRIKPDFVSNGKEYIITNNCVRSHSETNYRYHYGYNFMSGKMDWHWGYETETVCDQYKLDTIEVNLDKKYYTKK